MKPDPHILFVAWRSADTRMIHPVGRLLEHASEPRYEFAYIRGVEAALEDGFLPFVEFGETDVVYWGDELFPLFRNRLMSSSRSDYADYLARLGLEPAIREPITILARSAARKTTDRLELFGMPEFDPDRAMYVYHILARGIRHLGTEERVLELNRGERLFVVPDPENPYDQLALKLETTDDRVIAYVPHTLVEDLCHLRERGCDPQASVVRVNPPPAPSDQRLLCRLEVGTVEGFVPYGTVRYQPLSRDATQLEVRTPEPAA